MQRIVAEAIKSVFEIHRRFRVESRRREQISVGTTHESSCEETSRPRVACKSGRRNSSNAGPSLLGDNVDDRNRIPRRSGTRGPANPSKKRRHLLKVVGG